MKPAFAGMADFEIGGTTFRKQINRRYPDLKIEHVHHAGNSSGVVDGAAALLLTSKDYADKHGLKPRARVVTYVNMGDDPTLMLNAPSLRPRRRSSALAFPRTISTSGKSTKPSPWSPKSSSATSISTARR